MKYGTEYIIKQLGIHKRNNYQTTFSIFLSYEMKRSQMKQQGEDRDLGRAKLFVHTFFSFLFLFVLFGGAIVLLFLSWSRRAKKMIQIPK